ncbi:hypothetical protein ACFOWU_00585 [Epilithonimonas zeae]|uniref:Carboxypeptidase-like regulatory domain-containing protein n=1 Tax=Epilithonimonas zeae TaxID=1416779 RepID=A0A1N6DX30_9FLAO|nr:hypothetical protein [Epilithonimonas zeae]SIN75345.1 hypothetical protein SAMN05444409_0121 [Epilithonimonas zeae]
MKKLLLVTFLFISNFIFSQQIRGRIVSDSVAVNQVLVVNINSQEKTYSDSKGQFLINANINDELRFVKSGYERKVINVENDDELLINIVKLAVEIEEVEVKKQLSGNLSKDSKLFDENKKKITLNNDLKVYFKAPSSAEVLNAKPGEFVQPVGGGISFGKIDDKWVLTDFVEWIRENLRDEYFTSMGLDVSEINSFLHYSLRTFNTRNILKYGFCDEQDVGNLKLHFEEKLKDFKK